MTARGAAAGELQRQVFAQLDLLEKAAPGEADSAILGARPRGGGPAS